VQLDNYLSSASTSGERLASYLHVMMPSSKLNSTLPSLAAGERPLAELDRFCAADKHFDMFVFMRDSNVN